MPALQGLEDRHLLSLSFAPAVTLPVGLRPESVVTADLNGDGRLDLITSNTGDNTISVRLGNGDSTFQAAQSYQAVQRPRRPVPPVSPPGPGTPPLANV